MDKAWKAVERKVAAKLGGVRNPLSGIAGGAGTHGDYVGRPYLYVETKHGHRWRVVAGLFAETKRLAKSEGKYPVVVVHHTASRDYLAVIDLDFLAELLELREKLNVPLVD